MKATELIEQLQQLVDEHGDLDIFYHNTCKDGQSDIDHVGIWFSSKVEGWNETVENCFEVYTFPK